MNNFKIPFRYTIKEVRKLIKSFKKTKKGLKDKIDFEYYNNILNSLHMIKFILKYDNKELRHKNIDIEDIFYDIKDTIKEFKRMEYNLNLFMEYTNIKFLDLIKEVKMVRNCLMDLNNIIYLTYSTL